MNHEQVYRLYRKERVVVQRKRKHRRAAGTARLPLHLQSGVSDGLHPRWGERSEI